MHRFLQAGLFWPDNTARSEKLFAATRESRDELLDDAPDLVTSNLF
jgi:hypothetical protein